MGVLREGARRFAPLALAAVVQLASAPSQAQNSSDKATAVDLFKRGRQLMEGKRYPEACPLFGESYRLDPSGGTLLNLAYCYEQIGQSATAWAYYQDLLGRSRREGRADRVRFAQGRLEALEPKLARWTLSMGPNEKLPGVEALRDGQVVPRPVWGSPVPIDPGPHKLEVRATDHRRWAGTFEIEAGKLVTVPVPPLEVKSDDSPPFDEAPTPAAVIIEAPQEPVAAPEAPPPRRPRGTSGHTVLGAIAGGVGVIGVGVGTYFGLSAFNLRSEVDNLCEDNGCSDPKKRDEADRYNSDGRRDAHLSTASFGVGLLGLGLGAYFLFIAPSASPSAKASNSVRVLPQLAPGHAGLSLTRAW